jgi:hypothetical protein
MFGRLHPRSSGGFAAVALGGAAVAALLRTLQFTAGLLVAYAFTYGISLNNLALVRWGLLLVIVSVAAAVAAKAPLAGVWATMLGISSLFALGLPRLLWPDCPHAGNCVDPGSQAASAVAGVLWICCVAWAAFRARRRLRPAV